MSTPDEQPDPDPFRGLPIFGDLARMLQQQAGSSWDAARQLAVNVATGGSSEPNVDPMERIRLQELARVAELHVARTTGLTVPPGVTVVPVTRAQWANATLDAYRPLFERLGGALGQAPPQAADGPEGADPSFAIFGQMMKMIGPLMLGMTAGSMVGQLAQRALGVYDLPIPRPGTREIQIVAANVDGFVDDWSLEADDLRLWVCLHELAHHTVLSLPHVAGRIRELLDTYAGGFRTDPGALEERLASVDIGDPTAMQGLQEMLGDPEVILGAIQSDAQRAMLPQLEAVTAVVAGYVDHVMDGIGHTLIGTYGQLTEALRRRRVEAAPADRFVERLLGLELTQTVYERGRAFVDGVVERAGDEALGRLWVSERELPTPNEVEAPGLWLARIDLPDD